MTLTAAPLQVSKRDLRYTYSTRTVRVHVRVQYLDIAAVRVQYTSTLRVHLYTYSTRKVRYCYRILYCSVSQRQRNTEDVFLPKQTWKYTCFLKARHLVSLRLDPFHEECTDSTTRIRQCRNLCRFPGNSFRLTFFLPKLNHQASFRVFCTVTPSTLALVARESYSVLCDREMGSYLCLSQVIFERSLRSFLSGFHR